MPWKADGLKWRMSFSKEAVQWLFVLQSRAKEKRDIIGMPCIQDENGNLKMEIGERLEMWRRYCEKLMIVENDWDGEEDYVPVEDPWEKVSEKEVWAALKGMKKSKSSGPSEVTCEMFSNDVCVRELCGVANGLLMGESMPESWKRSMVVLLYKGKRNVLECGH